MTTTDQVPEQTLQQQVEDFKAQMAGRVPAEVAAGIEKHIADLVASGIVEQSLKEGAKAPDFTLPDVLGKQVTLSELLQQGPVVVTFYRGEWCPYCNLQLHAYQNIVPQLQALGASLVAISPQTPDNSLTTAEKKGLTFTVLSDVGNKVARQYGLVFKVDEETRATMTRLGSDLSRFNGDDSWELPVPGTFVVAQDGTIRLAFADADFTHRLEPAALLDGVRAAAGK